MRTIHIHLTRHHYPIYIGQHLIQNTALFQKHIIGEQVMIVSQPPVTKHYLNEVFSTLNQHQCDHVLIEDGEVHKTLFTWQNILEALLEKKHRRDTTLIAVGGGVVGDITGFAAACYQRGVNFIQVPTTLLAQVDASVGGKTAVNHPLGKNMIGAFYQPQAVIIDINTLKTLPAREFHAGIAEIIKAALLTDAHFFNWLEENMSLLIARDHSVLIEAIEKAVQIKANIVTVDEEERVGPRALLNLGHTFAHAIEKCTHYQTFLHGEAVAIGLCLAATLSQQQGRIQATESRRIIDLVLAAQLPTAIPQDITNEQLIAAMTRDKKANAKGIVFILLSAIGRAVQVENIPFDKIERLLTYYRQEIMLE